MPKVQATTRTVKNLNTRLDAAVPRAEKVAQPRDVKHYYVLVVTKIINVKPPEFSGDDVVQFVVPSTFESFDKLHSQLTEQFPQHKQTLPPLPRRKVLFLNSDTIGERRAAFDSLVKFISKTEKLAKSVPFYDFLGIDPLGDKVYMKLRQKWLEDQKIRKEKEEGFKQDDIFDDEEENDETDEADLLKGVSDSLSSQVKAYPTMTSSLLDDQTSDEERVAGDGEMSPEVADLLQVQSTMEDVLTLTSKGTTSLVGSSAVKNDPSSSKKMKKPEPPSVDATGMDKLDILKYISSQTTTRGDGNDDDDLDLF